MNADNTFSVWFLGIFLPVLGFFVLIVGTYVLTKRHYKIQGNKSSMSFWSIFFLFVSVAFIILAFLAPYMYIGVNNLKEINYQNTGVIGDTIGGLMNPFIGIAAVIVTGLAFYAQYQANKQVQDQFTTSMAFERKKIDKDISDRHINNINVFSVSSERLNREISDCIDRVSTMCNTFSIDQEYTDESNPINLFSSEMMVSIKFENSLDSFVWLSKKQNFKVDVFINYYHELLNLKSLVDFFNLNFQKCLVRNETLIEEVYNTIVELIKLQTHVDEVVYKKIHESTLESEHEMPNKQKWDNYLKSMDDAYDKNAILSPTIRHGINTMNKLKANLVNIESLLSIFLANINSSAMQLKKFNEEIAKIDLSILEIDLNN